ncbi:MAG TPA: iron uptake transporter deferrochelatase/peroxidase subunit [Actinomycetes bacterium]|nr:iron uptake transporter deferrochelatase/peroxidase subunit [Actinomycetes bacterium]
MSSMQPRLSRRALFGLAGAGAVAAGVGGVGVARAVSDASASDTVAFYGEHQAGIATAQQTHVLFSAFDVVTRDVGALTALLQGWTQLAAALTQGEPVGDGGAFGGLPTAPPEDNGEAELLSTANLTITVGFGRTLFVRDDADRFGLESQLPDELQPIPSLPFDALDAARSDGDIALQVCADDPQVAMHAMRVLKREAIGVCTQRWTQSGFLSRPTDGSTPRNLFGFKDGTANVRTPTELNEHVWADGAPEWMNGGSYLVARRIAMTIEVWDRTSLVEQETIVGRRKGTGAPLSGGAEFTDPNFEHTASDGQRSIAKVAHVRLAHPSRHDGRRMLRRGFNYEDGVDQLGRWDAGLFFLAYSKDPRSHVIPAMTDLARHDVMNEYIRHTASAAFAMPPGVQGSDDWWGRALFT